jgi:hypothetical protein
MAKSAARNAKQRPAAPVKEERLVKGVRLDLSPADHARLERVAKDRGLTMASYARMVLLERMRTDEARV